MAIIPIDEMIGQNSQVSQQNNIIPIDDLIQQGQSSQGFRDPSTAPDNPVKSPLSLVDRMQLSFADDNGRRNKLQEKFAVVRKLENGKYAVGDNPNQLTPIDPGGVFNDVLGDLADVVGEIPVIAGQILGTAMGAGTGVTTGGTTSVPGAITGSMIGAGFGEGVKKGVGKMLGVNEQTATEMATDIAISSAFGAAGEGIAQGTRLGAQATKRVLAPKLVKMLSKNAEKAAATGKLPLHAKVTSKLFQYLAEVPEESTNTFYKYGIQEMNNPKNFDKKAILGLVDDGVKNLNNASKKLGEEVYKQTDALINTAKRAGATARIDVDDLFAMAKKQAQSFGVLDDFGKVNKNYPITADRKPIMSLLKELGEFKEGRFVRSGKTISAKKAVQISRSFGQKFDNVSGNVKSIFHNVLNGDESIAGIRPRLNELASSLGLDDYAQANAKFSKFTNLSNKLKSLDTKKPGKIETFINNLENLGEISKRDLYDLEKYTTDNFVKRWELWNAGQDFTKTKFSVLRFASVAAILGGITGFDTKESKAGTIAGAALLGTPAGLRLLLRSGTAGKQAVSKLGGTALKKGSSTLINKKGSGTIISELLKNRDKK